MGHSLCHKGCIRLTSLTDNLLVGASCIPSGCIEGLYGCLGRILGLCFLVESSLDDLSREESHAHVLGYGHLLTAETT